MEAESSSFWPAERCALTALPTKVGVHYIFVVAELDLGFPFRDGPQHAGDDLVVALAVDGRDAEGCREQSFSSLEVDRAVCFANDGVGQSFGLVVGKRV